MNKKKLKTKWWSESWRKECKSFCYIPFAICCLLQVIFLFAISIETRAQSVPIGDPIETYIRLLQPDFNQDSTSSYHIRPAVHFMSQISGLRSHPWETHAFFDPPESSSVIFTPYVPEFKLTNNSDFAFGQNDNALWQGKGYNVVYTLGGEIKFGPVEIAMRPAFGYSDNEDFDLAPSPPFFQYPEALSEYAEGLARIDSPQRFGEKKLRWFHPGQSHLRVHQAGVAVGISTANMWTGPAMLNPLTMSNNAPGFVHAFLETDGPYSTPYGNIEAKLFWGGLQESDYFDENESNNLRYINGLIFNYSPFFFPGFHVGFSRTFYEYYPEKGLAFENLTRVFQPFTEERFAGEHEIQLVNEDRPRTVTGDDAVHMLTFFGRWVVPNHGFEAWFEWGKNENSFDKRNLLNDRVHTRSYVLGLLKRFELNPQHWITFNFEMTHLENLEDIKSNDYPVWYENLIVNQGFTHQGQVLGAGIGPGSNSQMIRLDYLNRWGKAGASVNRVAHHNDRLYRHFSHIHRNQEFRRGRIWQLFEVEFRYGFHALLFLPYNLEIQGDVYRSQFINIHNTFETNAYNTNVQVTLRYNLPSFLR